MKIRSIRRRGDGGGPCNLRKALAVHGFVDWYGMRRLLERARPVAELLRGLIAEGRGAVAFDLSAYERIDDSAGI